MQLKNFLTIQGKSVDIEIDNNDEIVIDGHHEIYISQGWIDIHTHCFDKFDLYGDRIDEVGYKKGVCMVVDSGTSGANDIDEFISESKEAVTNAKIWLNVSEIGLLRQNELSDMHLINEEKIIEAIKKYPNEIIGLKVRMSHSVVGENGDKPLLKALEIAEKVNLPLMVHVGNPPSDIETVAKLLRRKDVMTHTLNPKENGILDKNGCIKEAILDAYQRGVYFDVGHGSDSFGYEVAKKALQQGFKCHTISTDIYRRNRNQGPVFSLGATMSKMLTVGYSLEEIIDKVTRKPMEVLGMSSFENNYTLFKIIEGTWILPDSVGNYQVINRLLRPVGVVVNGKYYYLEEPK